MLLLRHTEQGFRDSGVQGFRQQQVTTDNGRQLQAISQDAGPGGEEGYAARSGEMRDMPFTIYLRELREKLRTGQATEATHYSTLATLLKGLEQDITAISEPKAVACGMPDIAVKRGQVPVGSVECKDIGQNLDKWEKDEQLLRYRNSLPNLILTDYLEFRWYVEGELRGEARLGRLDRDGEVRSTRDGIKEVEELLRGFLLTEPPIAATAQELARYMARAAKAIRDATEGALSQEPEAGELHGQLQAFRQTLIPDLTPERFADMYAQTIAYGLFSACFELRRPPSGTGFQPVEQDNKIHSGRMPDPPRRVRFTRQIASQHLPATNPFLQDLFDHITGRHMPQPVAEVVDNLAELLNRAEMGEIKDDFARRPDREDPVVHFYEDFLREYDPQEKKLRGVYYTPDPVVKYIVRSIDYLLKEKFDKPLGLADEEVYILDPACGTGTFLYFVIDQIYHNVCEEKGKGAWKSYVQERLLSRVFGFELLMAPYTIAHMKLSIQLRDLGYNFSGDERLGIYLTNSLEEAIELAEGQLRLGIERTIAEESEAAGDIKLTKPIMVVLGNPPYAGHSANVSQRVYVDPETGKRRREKTWIGNLIEDYKYVDGERLRERQSKWLQDDYVKFIRFAQWRIEQTGHGIIGMITNHGYLDNPTFRGMRQSLMDTFNNLWLLDLHGSSKKKETTPKGGKDENVFDIQQGVAVGIFLKEPGEGHQAKICHADLWGTRQDKYESLMATDVQTTEWSEPTPQSPFYSLVPYDTHLWVQYARGWPVTDIMPDNNVGFVTARDRFVIDFEREPLKRRIEKFRDETTSEEMVRERYRLRDTSSWNLREAREALRTDENWDAAFGRCLYRPFDMRHIYYSEVMVERPVRRIQRHMIAGSNLAVAWTRPMSPTYEFSVIATEHIVDQCVVGNKSAGAGISYLGPLYLYPEEGTTEEGRRANLNGEFVKEFAQKLGLTFIPDAGGDLTDTFGPEDVFYYAYAVFHCPTYRQRYAEFLKIDFPRLPLTADKELFAKLVAKGQRLADLHLLRQTGNIGEPPKFNPPNSDEVQRVRYDDENQRVYINKKQYFSGIEPEVWEFHIGGYQVCQKWLKDRKGRQLSYDDITHYQKIVLALRETISLMAEIDEIIPGWPME